MDAPPKIKALLKERLAYSKQKEVDLRLKVAALEGEISEAKHDIIEHQEVIKFLEPIFNG